MKNDNYLPKVKKQYESLPYPMVDPQEDRSRLKRTWLEDLPMINHYCFRGRQNFSNRFRVLVAGGGTGDATIFMAEQLRNTNAEIVHLDLSSASIALAQERARIRGLANIRWIEESLLNIPELGLGEFDYINCVGVLHHLADPDAGLRALKSALKPDGAIACMVYGQIGRTGLYHMQDMLRLAQAGLDDDQERIDQAKEVLAALPEGNWFRLAGELYRDHKDGDADIYDMLLHSQDRAYTVPQLYEWLEDGHDFHIQLSDVHRGRFPYMPELTLGLDAKKMRARLPGMSQRDRYAMSELLIGDLTRHNMYLTRKPGGTAPYGEADYIPFFFHEPLNGPALERVFAAPPGQPARLQHQFLGMTATVVPGPHTGRILRHMDGMRTFGEIFDLVRADPAVEGAPDNAALFADFKPVYELLNAIERILLRHATLR